MERYKNKNPNSTARVREQMIGHLPRLRRFAYALTGSPADADDLLQGTVERVLSKGVPEDANVLKWMYRVSRNLWIDEIRSRSRGPEYSDPAAVADTAEDPGQGETATHDRLDLDGAHGAMQKLSVEQRQVLALVALEQYSYRETAEILEIPIGTVMSRLTRARTRMAQLLDWRDTSSDN